MRRHAGSLCGALRACANVGGPLEAAAREIFRRLAVEHRTTVAIGRALNVSERHVRRLASVFNFDVHRTVVCVPGHPVQSFCSCVDCAKARAA